MSYFNALAQPCRNKSGRVRFLDCSEMNFPDLGPEYFRDLNASSAMRRIVKFSLRESTIYEYLLIAVLDCLLKGESLKDIDLSGMEVIYQSTKSETAPFI